MNVSLDYIAKMYDVSKATVSRVLNDKPGVSEETRQRVLEGLRKYGYKEEARDRIKSLRYSRIIGVIVPELENPFFTELVVAIEEYAGFNGYQILLMHASQRNEKELIKTLISIRVDGLLLTSATPQNDDTLELVRKYKMPTILLDRNKTSDQYIAGVYADNEYSVFMAVDKLIKLDHMQPFLILGPKGLSTTEERRNGYLEALKFNNLPYKEEFVTNGDYSYQSGYKAIYSAINSGLKINSIMACNDLMAIGAIKALKEFEIRIPDDVDVIGFDNIQISEMIEPKLTTVSQPVKELGREAVKTLIKLIQGERIREHSIRLDVQFIERGTTKRHTQNKQELEPVK